MGYKTSGHHERRRESRHHCLFYVDCTVGSITACARVLDFSESGLHMRMKGHELERGSTVEMLASESPVLEFRVGKVMWARPLPDGNQEVGLTFMSPPNSSCFTKDQAWKVAQQILREEAYA